MGGERQLKETLAQIAPDHRLRYEFAREVYRENSDEPFWSGNVLDLGCGCGYGSYILGEHAESVIAIDNEASAVQFGMGFYPRPNITFAVGDVTTELLESWIATFEATRGQVDMVVAFEILEHLEEPGAVLKSLHPKVLVASVPNQDVIPFSEKKYPYHKRHYTIDELVLLLSGSGYEVIDIYTQYDKWDGTIHKGVDGKTIIAIAEVKQ